MTIVDYVALGIFVVMAIIGYCVGFGKALKFFTGGIFGIIISLVVTVIVFNPVRAIPMVDGWGTQFNDMLLAQGNEICTFLAEKVPTYNVVVGIAIFLVAQVLRMIVVAILKNIAEIRLGFFRFLNRFFGAILIVAVVAVILCFGLEVVHLIGGDTEATVVSNLTGTTLKLDAVYEFLTGIFDKYIPALPEIPTP